MDNGPTFGCSFGHEGKGISDLFVICGIDIFTDQEISSYCMVGGSIICLGHVEMQFSRFDCGHGWCGWW